MEKKKEKSYLISQLYDYLEEQIQLLKTDRHQLNRKMYEVMQEKNEKEGTIENQQKIYQIRKIFSPLPLEIEESKQSVSEDVIKIEKDIKEFQKKIHDKDHRIEELLSYQKGLEEDLLFDDIVTEDVNEDEKIPFVPAFDELMKYIKKIYPTARLNYRESKEESKVCMTFSFLKGFHEIFETLMDDIGVFVINFEKTIDKYKILIKIEAKPKIIKNAKEFYEKRSGVTDLAGLTQSIINSSNEMVQTSSTAQTMVQNFQETQKIYDQSKKYYDTLKKVKNLVRSARKVQQCILFVGEISDMYVSNYQLMLSDKNFSVRELAAIASGYTRILQGSANTLKDLQGIINPSDLSMTDKDRLDVVDKTYAELLRLRNLTSYYTRQNLSVSYIRARKSNDMERTLSLYGTDEDKYW